MYLYVLVQIFYVLVQIFLLLRASFLWYKNDFLQCRKARNDYMYIPRKGLIVSCISKP